MNKKILLRFFKKIKGELIDCCGVLGLIGYIGLIIHISMKVHHPEFIFFGVVIIPLILGGIIFCIIWLIKKWKETSKELSEEEIKIRLQNSIENLRSVTASNSTEKKADQRQASFNPSYGSLNLPSITTPASLHMHLKQPSPPLPLTEPEIKPISRYDIAKRKTNA
jgi:hypothetical protein